MESVKHPHRDDIERYAIGALDEVQFADIQLHFRTCEACAAELQREARLDLAIGEVARTLPARSALRGYTIERTVSGGGSVRTHDGRSPAGEKVVIKEVTFRTAPSLDVIASFEKEAALLRQLDHPGIPRYVDSFEESEGGEQRLYLVHRYVEGESLEARLAHHRFDEAEVIAIARDVLATLSYLHTRSPAIYHRDIRPANLLRTSKGRILLTSFGSARDLSVTSAGTIAGMFGYVPPGQLVGLVDQTSDLYALGATLIHLMTRRPPWQDENLVEAMKRAHMSSRLRAFLSKLVAPDALQRFHSAGEALDALNGRIPRPARRFSAFPAVVLAASASAVAATAFVAGRVSVDRALPQTPPPVVAEVATTGSLMLRSSPSGARVLLDGSPMMISGGRAAVTPCDLEQLRFGQVYDLRFELAGHEPFVKRILMAPVFDGTTIHGRLRRVPAPEPERRIVEMGTLAVLPDRPGVRVTVDGEYVGTGPIADLPLAPGSHLVELEARGYRSESMQVWIAGGARTTIDPALERLAPDGASGFATIRTIPEGANVTIDGIYVGVAPIARHRLATGRHAVDIVWVDGRTRSTTIDIEEDRVRIFRFDPDPR
jgi:hypothetical protein